MAAESVCDTMDQTLSPGLQRQRDYIDRQIAAGLDDSIVVGEAFVNGIRDLGYRSTATALNEIYDNAIQAQATKIHTVFGYGGSDAKPSALAIVDDGFGMLPDMLGYAVKWGGTDREGDRRGFGRYGYGLPSSCVSQGLRFRVYSRIAPGETMFAATVDLEEIRSGMHTAGGGRVLAPKPAAEEPPAWLRAYLDAHFDGLPHGTVVLIDKLDRLTWKTANALRKNLLENCGVVYRNFLRNVTMVIDGVKVDPIDPLFLTPSARFYDIDADRAESQEDIEIDVTSEDGRSSVGKIKVRVAYLPPTFGYKDKTLQTNATNPRMTIMGLHEGLIVMRNGRQMDVLMRAGWKKGLTFRNTDRYWQVELDFPAVLDEEFSVTTSKQGVRLSDRIWALLREADLDDVIAKMQSRHELETKAVKDANENLGEEERPFESAVRDAEIYFAAEPPPPDPEIEAQAQENFNAEVQRRASETGVPEAQVREALQLEIQRRPLALVEKSEPGNVFYRPERVGTQRRVYLNTAHPFYKELYAGPTSSPEIRRALSVLILTLAAAEFDARDQRLEFYENERSWWSNHLKTSLRQLAKKVPPPEPARETIIEDAADAETTAVPA
jgi:Histidine kinase-, DNA gyrase B-, and HSP90-like ATPase